MVCKDCGVTITATTKSKRGMLCFSCNILVGHLESPMREAAEKYIAEFGA